MRRLITDFTIGNCHGAVNQRLNVAGRADARLSQRSFLGGSGRARPVDIALRSRILFVDRLRLFFPLTIPFRNYEQPSIGSLAKAFGCDPRIVLQRGVNNAPISRAQSIYGYRLSLSFGFFTEAQRHVFERFFPPLTIILDIDEDVRPFASLPVPGDARHEVLQSFQGLTFATDQQAAIITDDFQNDLVGFVAGL